MDEKNKNVGMYVHLYGEERYRSFSEPMYSLSFYLRKHRTTDDATNNTYLRTYTRSRQHTQSNQILPHLHLICGVCVTCGL